MSEFVVGIDVGGTFTDLVLLDDEGQYQTFKTPSTPANPATGILDILRKAASFKELSLEEFLDQIRFFVHGTTVATNAMVQGHGARVGLITTKGFRDALEIRCGRIKTTQAAMWDIRARPPDPLVPRYLRCGVQERVDSHGRILIPLEIETVKEALNLFQQEKVESIAVSLLFSFANPSHEQQIREIIKGQNSLWPVSLSSDISPTIKEYERTSSTVVNAFVQPLVSQYLANLEMQLSQQKLAAKIMVTQSNGGLMDVAYASKKPINTLLSGPAAGVTGATFYGQVIGSPNLVLMDMGGTSFDVSLIKNGNPLLRDFTDISNHYIQTPSIDIHTIGTGGGSIAYVDSGDILHVGPHSAGADPGPACYAKGGKEPTVTDAYVVLGLINPDYFLGGEILLDQARAWKAIELYVAQPLGISPEMAAAGIVRISNQQMADAIRRISFEKGEDIRNYGLIAAGGAGPVCAAMIAQDLGISQLLCPRLASTFCAMGMLVADLRHDLIRSHIARLDELNLEKVNHIFTELEDAGRKALIEEGIDEEAICLTRSIDMRYYLQIFEIEIPVEEPLTGTEQLSKLGQRFNKRHLDLYGFEKRRDEIEVVNLRVVSIGKIGKELVQPIFGRPQGKVTKMKFEPELIRPVYFPYSSYAIETPIFKGTDLSYGFITSGPAIVEETTTTVVVPPNQTLQMDPWGNFIITRTPNNQDFKGQ